MAMKRCPICGEKYSDTYKSCPFCEEEEALQSGAQIRRTAPGRGGKRTAARGRQPNLLSPILIVLIVIMAALLVYLLFGDRIAQRLSGGEETQDTSTEAVTPQPPDPDTADPEGGDGVTMPERRHHHIRPDGSLHPAGDADHRLPGFPPDGVHHVRGR